MAILKHFLSFSLLIGVPSCYASEGRSMAQKPNILFILVDDMQSDAIRALGNKEVETPSIDGLMNRGVTFTRTYTNGALCGALSMPSRAMLITGRGVFEVQSDGWKIPEGHTTLPEQLRKNGYHTFTTGKWHSDKASLNRSFADGENIFLGGMHTYESNGHCSPLLHRYDPTGRYAAPFVGTDFSSKMFADATLKFLDSRRGEKQPFMAYVAFTSPHDPRNQLPDYGKKYVADQLSVPVNFLPQHPFDNGELDIRDEQVLPAPRTAAQMQKELALYYGMVSEVDYQIGRIIKKLEESGQRENTIIVFASDNGLAMGQNGLLGKQSLYDHSVGVPLTIIDPRSRRAKKRSAIEGKRSDALCYLSDVYPTLCDLVGVETPSSVTGRSLKNILDNKTKSHRESLFLVYANQQRGLIHKGYKYIIYNVEGKITEQLFDLKRDPWEMNNLAEREVLRTANYRQLLQKEMKQHQDFCDLDRPMWWMDGHKLTWEELIKLYVFDKNELK